MTKTRKKMWAQLMMLAGGLLLAFGGFWSWKISEQEDELKGITQETRFTKTDSIVKSSADTILKHQESSFKKLEEAINSTKKIVEDLKSKQDEPNDGKVVIPKVNAGDEFMKSAPQLGQAELAHILQLLQTHETKTGKSIKSFNLIVGINSNGGAAYARQVSEFLQKNGYINVFANHGFTTQVGGDMKPFELVAYDQLFKIYINP
jgi:hypothetical protein